MGVGIQVKALNAWYGKTQALYDINLHMQANHAYRVNRAFGLRKVNLHPLP
jgi:ABC-type arginine transport system ATPase subunit